MEKDLIKGLNLIVVAAILGIVANYIMNDWIFIISLLCALLGLLYINKNDRDIIGGENVKKIK